MGTRLNSLWVGHNVGIFQQRNGAFGLHEQGHLFKNTESINANGIHQSVRFPPSGLEVWLKYLGQKYVLFQT